jgi:antitoxin component of MazEF toxin-antitoxin module
MERESKKMIKKLTKQGNSSALIFDRTILALMEIDTDTELKVTLQGRKMIVEPLSEAEREQKFQHALKRTSDRNADVFKELAK